MTKLEELVAYKRLELAQEKRARPVAQLEKALKTRPPLRSFRQAIHRPGRLSLIAEVKRASPSAGTIRPVADAKEIAQRYAEAGAQAVSVLTDAKFFSGSLSDLESVREAVSLPVLRKDFVLEEYSLLESAASGADAILFIVKILTPPVLKRLLSLAHDLKLDPLMEVHTEAEVEESLDLGAEIVGINNRDLATFQVDLKTTERLIRLVPQDRTVVSESGIRSREEVEWVQSLGVHAVLIGEELMASDDVEKRIRELMGW